MSDSINQSDRSAARAALRAAGPAGPCLDEMALASYVDGRVGSRERDAVEAHLAGCPRCLRAVREARELLAQALAMPPLAVLRRAGALRPAPKVGVAATAWSRVAVWSASAAAAVVFGTVGLLAGSGLGASRGQASVRTDREVAFDVARAPGGAVADDALEVLLDVEEDGCE